MSKHYGFKVALRSLYLKETMRLRDAFFIINFVRVSFKLEPKKKNKQPPKLDESRFSF